ncbi:MAG: GTPase Era [Anaerolineales bacterium]|nr:GTPase Era [Anaerolineales bacterium]
MTNSTEDTLFRSGFLALIGRPNVGKSTLMNAILQHNLAAVSARPQTTRRTQAGILTLPHAQLIFIDTPGIHEPVHKLGKLMNHAARTSLEDADLHLIVFDASMDPTEEDRLMTDLLKEKSYPIPRAGLLNKADLVSEIEMEQRKVIYKQLLPDTDLTPVSAVKGIDRTLIDQWIDLLLPGPMYYPEDQLTVDYERDIAAEMIRSAAMEFLHHEVPHSIAVRIDQYKERSEELAYIKATIFVERESQKGIVIGKQGMMLRKIGTAARKEIESMSGRKIYLELRVKVLPGWRNDDRSLKQLGY